MNGIGWAVKQMQQGAKVSRSGWNGKGMWISLVSADQYGLGSGQNYDYGHVDSKVLPWVGMRTADGSFVPWLCSQTDLLATDWDVVQ